jgi:leader peptidase (prepilin peptidase) / N-methyltransferase
MACLWTAATWRLVAAGLTPAVPAYLVLIFVCLVLAAVDLSAGQLPNRITYTVFPVVAALLLAASVALGDLSRMSRAAGASVLVTGLFLLLGVAYPRGVGLGDVKFMATVALALGWLSWSAVVVGLVAAFLLGGLAGVIAMLVWRLDRHTPVPFGPWLAAGTLVALLAAEPITAWYGHRLLGV